MICKENKNYTTLWFSVNIDTFTEKLFKSVKPAY